MILNEHTVCNINVGGKTWKISTMRLDLTKYGGHLQLKNSKGKKSD